MNKPKNSPARKMIAENRKARFNFEILDTLEAGLVLTGTEVKSLRANQANIAESYASFEDGEFWLINSYIPEYTQGNRFNHEPRRLRKLLVSRREMSRLFNSVSREGMTVVPLKLYFNDRGRAKLELALARGKKTHDKRETEKKRDWNREKRVCCATGDELQSASRKVRSGFRIRCAQGKICIPKVRSAYAGKSVHWTDF
ncbi:SsrA-binding protein SmpB [Brucella suis bv. 1]|nr:SsrA-binding protein SmpB [Brucella suis bv. 1]